MAKKKKTKEEQQAFDPTEGKYHDQIARAHAWFEVDKNFRSPISAELDECYKQYKGDHWDLLDANGRTLRTPEQKQARPNSVENISFALVEGLVAEFSEDMDLIDYGVEEGDDNSASKMTDLKKFILYKNRFPQQRTKFLRNFFGYGTGIWHPYFDPSWRGGKGPNRWEGDIRIEAPHLKTVFPDARCSEDIEEGRRIHKAVYRTQEYIKEKFGVDVISDIVDPELRVGEDSGDLLMAELGEEQGLLVETWYKGSPLILEKGEEDKGPGLHVIWWAGESPVYLAHDNYVYYEPGEEAKFPFIFKKRYPRENSVWGFGELHFLRSPQIILNKTSELIIEGHMHSALGQTLYQEQALSSKQRKMVEQFGTMAGVWIPMKDPMAVNRIHGKGVPESLLNETTRIQRMMETVVGRFDISQGRTPGSVTAFRALDLLAARAQVRLRSAEKCIVEGYEDLGNYTNNLIITCYEEKRTYRILGDQRRDDDTGGDRAAPKYGEFDPKSLRKIYFPGPGSPVFDYNEFDFQFAEALGFEEGVDYEIYCPQFDSMCKVSTTMPTDRMFYLEVAKELLAAELIDAEIFWYVVSRGKFPPYEELVRREKEKAIAQQQMMMQQQQEEQAQLQMQMGMQQQAEHEEAEVLSLESAILELENLFKSNPELAAKFAKLTPEQQKEILHAAAG